MTVKARVSGVSTWGQEGVQRGSGGGPEGVQTCSQCSASALSPPCLAYARMVARLRWAAS
eukprot:1117759-Prorocentrum_minimum.AAC.1